MEGQMYGRSDGRTSILCIIYGAQARTISNSERSRSSNSSLAEQLARRRRQQQQHASPAGCAVRPPVALFARRAAWFAHGPPVIRRAFSIIRPSNAGTLFRRRRPPSGPPIRRERLPHTPVGSSIRPPLPPTGQFAHNHSLVRPPACPPARPHSPVRTPNCRVTRSAFALFFHAGQGLIRQGPSPAAYVDDRRRAAVDELDAEKT